MNTTGNEWPPPPKKEDGPDKSAERPETETQRDHSETEPASAASTGPETHSAKDTGTAESAPAGTSEEADTKADPKNGRKTPSSGFGGSPFDTPEMRAMRERLKREEEEGARGAEAQQGPTKEARAKSAPAPDDSEGPKKGKTRTTAKKGKAAEAKKEGATDPGAGEERKTGTEPKDEGRPAQEPRPEAEPSAASAGTAHEEAPSGEQGKNERQDGPKEKPKGEAGEAGGAEASPGTGQKEEKSGASGQTAPGEKKDDKGKTRADGKEEKKKSADPGKEKKKAPEPENGNGNKVFEEPPEPADWRNWWEFLGVSPIAKPAEVKKAILKMQLKYHTDRWGGHPDHDKAEEAFKRVGFYAEAHKRDMAGDWQWFSRKEASEQARAKEIRKKKEDARRQHQGPAGAASGSGPSGAGRGGATGAGQGSGARPGGSSSWGSSAGSGSTSGARPGASSAGTGRGPSSGGRGSAGAGGSGATGRPGAGSSGGPGSAGTRTGSSGRATGTAGGTSGGAGSTGGRSGARPGAGAGSGAGSSTGGGRGPTGTGGSGRSPGGTGPTGAPRNPGATPTGAPPSPEALENARELYMKAKQASTNLFFKTTIKDARVAGGAMKMRGPEGRENLKRLRRDYEKLLKQEREHTIADRMQHINTTMPRGAPYEAAVKQMMIDLLKEEQGRIDAVAQKDDHTGFFDTRFKKIWHSPRVAKQRLAGGLAIVGASLLSGGTAGAVALGGILGLRFVGGFMAGEASMERYSSLWGHKGETDKIFKKAVDAKDARRLAKLESTATLTAEERAERHGLRTKIDRSIRQEVATYDRDAIQQEIARLQMLQGEKRTALKNAGRAGGKTARVVEALMERDAELTAKEIVENRDRKTAREQLAGFMTKRLHNETKARNQQIETHVERERRNKLKRKVAAGVLAAGFTAASFAVSQHYSGGGGQEETAAHPGGAEDMDRVAEGVHQPGVRIDEPPPPPHGGGGSGGTAEPLGSGPDLEAPGASGPEAGTAAATAAETVEKSGHYVCVEEGGNAWEASKALQERLGWSDEEWAHAWSESTTVVDGETVRLSDLSMIHEGDTFTAIDTPDGPRIAFESASGLKAGDNQALLETLLRERRPIPEWLAEKTGWHPADTVETAGHGVGQIEEISAPDEWTVGGNPEDLQNGQESVPGVTDVEGYENVDESEGVSRVAPDPLEEHHIAPEDPWKDLRAGGVESFKREQLQGIFGTLRENQSEWPQWRNIGARKFMGMEFPKGSPAALLQGKMRFYEGTSSLKAGGFWHRRETVDGAIERMLRTIEAKLR